MKLERTINERTSMSLTLRDIMTILSTQYPEDLLLELLEINSEELVERFSDKIEAKFDSLQQQLEDEM